MTMLSLRSPEDRVPQGHPLREVKRLADEVLAELNPIFDEMYSGRGRKSVPPERLLMALYSVRSERLFCEQLDYNLLFRWFLDMDMVEPSFDHSTFSRNRERLLKHEVAESFLMAIVDRARRGGLLSDEHFTVDGTLIEAWASLKSFKPKNNAPDGSSGGGKNPDVDFEGHKRKNETHASTTDPESRLLRKGLGKEAKLCFAQHVLMENRNGLVVDVCVTEANGRSERQAALTMIDRTLPSCRRRTLGADKGYNTRDFVDALRKRSITPHVASKKRANAIDGRTTRHHGYAMSQRKRKLVEEIFGWSKTIGAFRKTRFKGINLNDLAATLTAAAYNLLRMAKLLPVPI
jgi:transposase